jgi:hypothetical protein
MGFIESFLMAMSALRANKMRSALTLLGMVIGVFAIIVVVSLASSYLIGPGDEEPEVLNQTAVPAPTSSPLSTAEPVATPTAVATPTPVPVAAGPVESTVTLVFSGEILSHGPVITQAGANGDADTPYDYTPMFGEVNPLLEMADFAICHLETPVSPDNSALSGWPVFNAPRELTADLKASGYDACSTASNHSLDRGPSGIRATIDGLEAAGLPQAGMSRTAEEKATPTLYEIGDITVGHLSYTYGLNGYVMPSDQPYLVDVTNVAAVLDEAAAAKAAGAEIVVLSIQWGNEYQVDPSQLQIDQATLFLESPDIDIIVGAHVHVVQPVEVINGKYVFYGIGNFLSNQSAACCVAASQNGIMVYVDLTGTEAGGYAISDVAFVPTRVDRSDYTIVPLPQALESSELDDATRTLYRTVIDSTTEVLTRRGVDIGVVDFN